VPIARLLAVLFEGWLQSRHRHLVVRILFVERRRDGDPFSPGEACRLRSPHLVHGPASLRLRKSTSGRRQHNGQAQTINRTDGVRLLAVDRPSGSW
jgi:hypothetical protein